MKIHGLSNQTLYHIWEGMVQRCCNKKHKHYKHYGGRGITISQEWRNDPSQFIEWALCNGWDKGLSIERGNVNGNYNPDNCTFIPLKLQNKNTRKSGRFTINGITDTIRGWALTYNINHCTLWCRLSKGMSIEEALTCKNQKGKRTDLLKRN